MIFRNNNFLHQQFTSLIAPSHIQSGKAGVYRHKKVTIKLKSELNFYKYHKSFRCLYSRILHQKKTEMNEHIKKLTFQFFFSILNKNHLNENNCCRVQLNFNIILFMILLLVWIECVTCSMRKRTSRVCLLHGKETTGRNRSERVFVLLPFKRRIAAISMMFHAIPVFIIAGICLSSTSARLFAHINYEFPLKSFSSLKFHSGEPNSSFIILTAPQSFAAQTQKKESWMDSAIFFNYKLV